MNSMKKLLHRTVLALAMAAVALGSSVASVSAAPDVTRACTQDNNNYHRYLQKTVSAYVDDMSADVVVQNLYPCSGFFSFTNGGPMVLPVNIQHFGSGMLAQLGYAKNGLTGNTLDWIFTPDVCSRPEPGVMARGTTFPNPVIGHRYRVRVVFIDSSGLWRFYVDDYADGLGNPVGMWANNGECRVNGNEVWAGFEVHDRADSLGGSVWTEIEQLSYKEWNDTTNIYMTDGTNFDCCGAPQQYWHTQVYNDPSPRDAIRAYTS